MKKLITLLFILLAANIVAIAQPVLKKGTFPKIGDTVVFYTALDTTAVRQGAGGKDMNWDYTVKTDGSTRYVRKYVAVSATPEGSSFPDANVAMYDPNGDGYAYYKISDDAYTVAGYVFPEQGGDVVQAYYDQEKERIAPMQYGDTLRDSFYCDYSLSSFPSERRGYTRTEYDAYGTLKLNGNTFTNVYRLHIVSHVRDSVDAMGTAVYVTSLINRYLYIKEGESQALLEVEYGLIDAMGSLQAYKDISIREDNYLSSIADNDIQASALNIYPNPADQWANLNFNASRSGIATIELLDIQGRLLRTEQLNIRQAGTQQHRMGLHGLPAGTYFIRLNSGRQWTTQKFMVR